MAFWGVGLFHVPHLDPPVLPSKGRALAEFHRENHESWFETWKIIGKWWESGWKMWNSPVILKFWEAWENMGKLFNLVPTFVEFHRNLLLTWSSKSRASGSSLSVTCLVEILRHGNFPRTWAEAVPHCSTFSSLVTVFGHCLLTAGIKGNDPLTYLCFCQTWGQIQLCEMVFVPMLRSKKYITMTSHWASPLSLYSFIK